MTTSIVHQTSLAGGRVQTADELIGAKLFMHMWTRGIKQKDLAYQLGMTPTNLNRKLKGLRAWSAQELVDIAEQLGLEVAELFSGVKPLCAIRDLNPEPADWVYRLFRRPLHQVTRGWFGRLAIAQ